LTDPVRTSHSLHSRLFNIAMPRSVLVTMNPGKLAAACATSFDMPSATWEELERKLREVASVDAHSKRGPVAKAFAGEKITLHSARKIAKSLNADFESLIKEPFAETFREITGEWTGVGSDIVGDEPLCDYEVTLRLRAKTASSLEGAGTIIIHPRVLTPDHLPEPEAFSVEIELFRGGDFLVASYRYEDGSLGRGSAILNIDRRTKAYRGHFVAVAENRSGSSGTFVGTCVFTRQSKGRSS